MIFLIWSLILFVLTKSRHAYIYAHFKNRLYAARGIKLIQKPCRLAQYCVSMRVCITNRVKIRLHIMRLYSFIMTTQLPHRNKSAGHGTEPSPTFIIARRTMGFPEPRSAGQVRVFPCSATVLGIVFKT